MSATYYMLECQDCTPVFPMPFPSAEKRDEWLDAHTEGTGHLVVALPDETRP